MPNDRLIRAARREPVDRPPVWLMRQAGRFLPEYRALRERHSILELCRNAELAAQASLTAVRALPGLDAAIVFSDLLLPLEPMGVDVRFEKGEGPVIGNPVRTEADVARLRPIDPERDLPGPLGAIRILRREVGERMSVIGFAGAPFTLASYLVEGGATRDYSIVKTLMWSSPGAWTRLADFLADAAAAHLNAQIAAGAQVVQVFDSWAGALSVSDYRTYVLPHARRLISAVKGAPVIHFAVGATHLLEAMREAGGDVIGVDWRIPLDAAADRLGLGVGIQGNLDPVRLLGPREALLAAVDDILLRMRRRPGFLFNLGHGVLPATPVENALAVVERVAAFRP